MKELPIDEQIQFVIEDLRRRAKRGTFDGSVYGTPYLHSCRVVHPPSGTSVIFTRDTGHHTSGWFKNPDYERCWHLSLSPIPSRIITLYPMARELDKKIRQHWLDAAFGEHLRWVWAESPKTPEGIAVGVWHWRLFCDARWQPILPRGEVYSTELTEAGWRSASQVLAEDGQYLSETEDGGEIVSVVDPS